MPDIEFRRDVDVSVLSERRTIAPCGMAGGESGQCGENIWIRHDEGAVGSREVSLGGMNIRWMRKGDWVIIREFHLYCMGVLSVFTDLL